MRLRKFNENLLDAFEVESEEFNDKWNRYKAVVFDESEFIL